MKKTNLLSALAVIITALGLSQTLKANVWRVNNIAAYNQYSNVINPNYQVFSSCSLAISNAAPGDTLYLEASANSYGTITLAKKLTIIGTGYFLSNDTGYQQNPISSIVDQVNFNLGSDGSTIIGLKISNGSFPNIYFSNDPINNVNITSCYIAGGIQFYNTFSTLISNIEISKNYILGYIAQSSFPGDQTGVFARNNYIGGIIFFASNQNASITQNVIVGTINIDGSDFFNNILPATTPNITVHPGVTANKFYKNVLRGTSTTISSFPAGTNYLSVPIGNIFATYPATYDAQLKPINTFAASYPGFITTEIGMFGGTDSYRLAGIPNIPSIYKLTAPATIPAGGTLNVTISTKANN